MIDDENSVEWERALLKIQIKEFCAEMLDYQSKQKSSIDPNKFNRSLHQNSSIKMDGSMMTVTPSSGIEERYLFDEYDLVWRPVRYWK